MKDRSEAIGPITGNYQTVDTIVIIKKGNPTYVAVWKEIGEEIQIVEVAYVGTHEKAPY